MAAPTADAAAAPAGPQPAGGRIQLKESFTPELKLASFYTGGQLALTADGQVLITPCGDDIKVLDLATGVVKHTLPGESETVTALAVSPDGQLLASGTKSLRLRFWSLDDGSNVRSLKAHDTPVVAMAFDGTSTLLATGASDGGVRVWDARQGFVTHNFKGHSAVISCVRFHPDANRWTLFSGADSGEIRVWDLIGHNCTAVLSSHVSSVRSLDLSPDGYFLLSAGRDQVLSLWNLRKNALEKTVPVFETLEAAYFVPPPRLAVKRKKDAAPAADSKSASALVAVTAGDKGRLRVWDLAKGAVLKEQEDEDATSTPLPFVDALWCPALKSIVGVTVQRTILFHDVATLKTQRQLVGTNDEVIDLRFAGPNESRLAVATTSEQIRLYDLATRSCRLIGGHTDVVLSLDVSGDGMYLASGSKDRDVRVWEWQEEDQSLVCVGVGVGHTDAVGAVALPRKPSNRFVLSASEDRTVKRWSWDGAEDGRMATDYTVLAHDKDINTVAFAPNDKLFVTGSQDRTAKVWNTADGALVGVCRGHKRGVWSAAFSPVDLVVATSSGDKTIKIWSLSDFSCLKTFEGHTVSVLRASFLTHGMQLLSAGSDGLLKLWTIKTNECVATYDAHDDRIWALAVKRDESLVATGAADSMIQVWRDTTSEAKAARLAEAERQLELEQDLSNYLQMKDYKHAVELCLTLDKPRRLLAVFTEILDNGDSVRCAMTARDTALGSPEIEALLRSLSNAQLEQVLRYVRDWNTNGKLSHVAQAILYTLLRRFTSEDLLALKEIKPTLQALIPYTERHLHRLDQLLTRSFIVDATLVGMDMLNSV